MNNFNKISVIVPVFNNEIYIESCLISIISQTYDNFELIVVDGASTDSTNDIIRKYGDHIDYFISEKDDGIYDAMNKGIDISTGDWLIFMGSDDRLYDKNVLKNVSLKLIDDGSRIVFGNIIYDNDERFVSSLDWRMFFRNTLHHQSAFYNKCVFEKTRFNTRYTILADYEINLIEYLARSRFSYIDLNVAKCSEFGVSKQVDIKGYSQEIDIKKKHLGFVASRILKVVTLFKYVIKKLNCQI